MKAQVTDTLYSRDYISNKERLYLGEREEGVWRDNKQCTYYLVNDTLFIFTDLPDIDTTKSIFREQNKRELKHSFSHSHNLFFIERWNKHYGGPFLCYITGGGDTIQFVVLKEPKRLKKNFLYKFEQCIIREPLVSVMGNKVGDNKSDVLRELGITQTKYNRVNTVIILDSHSRKVWRKRNSNFYPQEEEKSSRYEFANKKDYYEFIGKHYLYSPRNAIYLFVFKEDVLNLIFISYKQFSLQAFPQGEAGN